MFDLKLAIIVVQALRTLRPSVTFVALAIIALLDLRDSHIVV